MLDEIVKAGKAREIRLTPSPDVLVHLPRAFSSEAHLVSCESFQAKERLRPNSMLTI